MSTLEDTDFGQHIEAAADALRTLGRPMRETDCVGIDVNSILIVRRALLLIAPLDASDLLTRLADMARDGGESGFDLDPDDMSGADIDAVRNALIRPFREDEDEDEQEDAG